MSRLTEVEAKEMYDALAGFNFYNPDQYDECIHDEYGITFIGETAGVNWSVSRHCTGNTTFWLLTANGVNFRFDTDEQCNLGMIAIFRGVLEA